MPPRNLVDKGIYMLENNINYFDSLADLTVEKRARIFTNRAKTIYTRHLSQAVINAFVDYNEAAFSMTSILDVVMLKPYRFPNTPYNSLCKP